MGGTKMRRQQKMSVLGTLARIRRLVARAVPGSSQEALFTSG